MRWHDWRFIVGSWYAVAWSEGKVELGMGTHTPIDCKDMAGVFFFWCLFDGVFINVSGLKFSLQIVIVKEKPGFMRGTFFLIWSFSGGTWYIARTASSMYLNGDFQHDPSKCLMCQPPTMMFRKSCGCTCITKIHMQIVLQIRPKVSLFLHQPWVFVISILPPLLFGQQITTTNVLLPPKKTNAPHPKSFIM